MRVPETASTVALNDAFWRGERVPFEGPGADRGTVQRVADPLSVLQGESRYTLVPLEVQRVSGAGGLYLLLMPEQVTARDVQSAAFLGKHVRLLRLEHSEGVITATVVDARLGRPPSAAMQPGRSYRFQVEGGKLLELD